MKKFATVCARDCYDTCSMQAMVNGQDRLVSIRGEHGHPVTRGFVCKRGAKDPERVYRNRILYPQMRAGAKPGRDFRRTSWNRVLDEVGAALERVLKRWGPEKVLLLNYAGNMGLLTETYPQRLWNALDAVHTDGGVCSRSGHAALKLHYGSSHGMQPEDLGHQRLIVFWGFNPAVSAPHMWALAKRARKQNTARIVVIDPRRSESAARADLWLAPQPGTDVALAHGMARQLIDDHAIDREFIGQWTQGFQRYEAAVAPWSLEATAAATGVEASQIAQLASLYGSLRPSAVFMGIGFQKAVGGAESVRAISLLPALIGRHRGFFYGNGAGFAVDTAAIAGTDFGQAPRRVVSQVGLGPLLARGDFKFIFISGMNPALTLPDQTAVRRGLARKDTFVVVHDPHWSATADFADALLPGQTYLEKDDLVVPWSHWWVRRSQRVIAPLGQSRNEIDVMTGLARRLAIQEPWCRADPWETLREAFEDALEDQSWETLMAGELCRLKFQPRDVYPTPSGKIEFASTSATNAKTLPIPAFIPLQRRTDEFVLLNSSLREYTHSQFQEVFGPIPAKVLIHPQDAAAHGIIEGQSVWLRNPLGQVRVRAVLTGDVPRGVLWVPRQFPGDGSGPQNALTTATPQKLGGGSMFNSTLVTICGKQNSAL